MAGKLLHLKSGDPLFFSGSSAISLGGHHVTIDTDTVVTLSHHLSDHRLQAHPQ